MTNEEITYKILKERVAEARARFSDDDNAGNYAYVAGQLSMMLAQAVNVAVRESPQAAQKYLEGLLRESPKVEAD